MIRQGMGTIAVLMLTACTQLHTVSSTSTLTGYSHSEACSEVVESYTAVSLLSAEAKNELLQTLSSHQPPGDKPCDQLRLAVLLSKPGTNFRDDVEASRLLKIFLGNPNHAHAPDRSLAYLLTDIVDERQRLQAELHRLKKTISQELVISQTLARKLKQQHSATKVLQSQLDQLKSIERDINEKEQFAATPSADKKTDEPNQDTPD